MRTQKLRLSEVKSMIRRIVKEEIQNTDGIVVYHRSPVQFDKFDVGYASRNEDRQFSGWGLYFSNSIPPKDYGSWLYKVIIFKDKKDYVLIDLAKPVEKNIVSKIVKAVEKLNKNPNELIEFAYGGWLFYNALRRILRGNEKETSLFLYENGIDGFIRHHGGNSYDYVLFGTENIKIVEIKYDPYFN